MSTKYIASNWRLPNKAGVDSYLNDNYGLSFNGNNEHIDTGDAFTSLTLFSVSAWFKSDDTATAAQAIVSSRINSIGSSQGLDLNISGDVLFARIYNNGATQVTTAFTDTASWHHVAMTYNGTTLELFLDNVSQGTATGVYTNSAANWIIGKWNNGANYFNGSISEVAVFDYALSSTQVSTLYGSSSLGAGNPMALKPAPVAFYPLGDNSSGNPLTQPNEAVEDASVFEFDGNTTDIRINKTTLGITSSISISCWIKTSITSGTKMIFGESNRASKTNYILGQKNTFVQFGIFHASATPGVPSGVTFLNTQSYGVNISDNKWHNVFATFDGTTNSDSMKIYIDGNLAAQTTPLYPNINNDSMTDFPRIGAAADNTEYFDGKLSNIAVWNSDQSSEISNIYNSGVPATTYTNTPTAWYKLDQSANWDVSGSGYWDVPDASVNGNDGISSGMTSASLVLSDLSRNLPYDSYSFSFDAASSDYINLGTPSTFAFGTDDFSISGWVYLDTSSGFQWLFSTGTNFAFGFDSSRNLQLWVGGTATTPTFNINLNQWHHIVATRNSGTVTFYIDGVAHGTTYTRTDSISAGAYNYIGTFNIGQNHIDGKISSFSIFDEALTSTEVMKLYSNGMPQDLSSFSPAPVGWWTLGSNSFFNGTNFICKDLSGNGNDGTSVNAGVDALVGDTPRSEANGVATNQSIPENLVGTTKYSSNNSWSINQSESARVQDTP